MKFQHLTLKQAHPRENQVQNTFQRLSTNVAPGAPPPPSWSDVQRSISPLVFACLSAPINVQFILLN